MSTTVHTIERLMSPIEVARVLAVSPATVRRLIRDGDLRAVRVGGQHRVRPAELAAYTGGGKSEAA
jgi:excisionase family DNA binding protein